MRLPIEAKNAVCSARSHERYEKPESLVESYQNILPKYINDFQLELKQKPSIKERKRNPPEQLAMTLQGADALPVVDKSQREVPQSHEEIEATLKADCEAKPKS